MIRAWVLSGLVLAAAWWIPDPAGRRRPAAARAEPTASGFRLPDGSRILFLGDSITQAGLYTRYLEAYLLTRFPERRYELINLGLSSETVSGLSEPDHPFPRPNLHDRLERALESVRPTHVVACYGMNDGIYHPFSEERFRRFRDGIQRLREKVEAAGAHLTLVTPPPFDASAVKDRAVPRTAERFGYATPYVGYDGVLERYSRWLLSLRRSGVLVVDVHSACRRFLERVRRFDPEARLAEDGVHPNATGHWILAQELLLAWGAPAEWEVAEVDGRRQRVVTGTIDELDRTAGRVTFVWRMRLPLPHDPAWHPRLAELEGIDHRLNRNRLRITGLAPGRYRVEEVEPEPPPGAEEPTGRRLPGIETPLLTVTERELAEGIDLNRAPEFSLRERSLEVLRLVEQRERLLSPAWLSAVGHGRPGTPPGLPLEQALERAAEMAIAMRERARPVRVNLRVSLLPD